MFIRAVDDALEKLLRAELPLSEDAGDVTFDAPSSKWSAQLSRLTVNLFLYDVSRSNHPGRTSTQRVDPTGRLERRAPQPMVALSYLVSAWAGSPRDEHQLLGEVMSRLTVTPVLHETYVDHALASQVQLAVGANEKDKPREIWVAAGGQIKASFTLVATVAAESFDWHEAATAVQEISVLSAPVPEGVRR
jgi:hypothetical protein